MKRSEAEKYYKWLRYFMLPFRSFWIVRIKVPMGAEYRRGFDTFGNATINISEGEVLN